MEIDFPFQFKNQQLLKKALTHRSYLNEHREKKLKSNERLEFLGDAVLELVVSLYLYQKHPYSTEGKLTSIRAKVVQTKTLALAAKKLNLGKHLLLSKGEQQSGGRTNPSILADTFEAIIGAIYLDSNFKKAKKFIKKFLITPAEKLFPEKIPQNYKSRLQEEVQAKGNPSPEYKTLAEEGPDHAKTFKVAVTINGEQTAIGKGHSKQQAEQKAAKKALRELSSK